MKKKIAVSACLLGEACRYDGTDNRNEALLTQLADAEIIPFCPEDHAFGTPRPTMDLITGPEGIRAVSNETGEDLSLPVEAYAKEFFDSHPDIDLFIGKDRSPSCGVCSARLYDAHKILVSDTAAGLMAKEAKARGIEAIDAEKYMR
ncbi:DUF523 domain-containing protein [Sulfurovum riftiae]|uniref:Uncharacterized protein n=1 Tax=Sulfurovum riftiae TaxID=1630136 RepID=A0A151CGP9_9BACT|nr:DUF523 domain-containing protein [Sulfurovum riftiae]KYJ86708.1 hypothetical protein AS592_07735 [Sulfurovum riftiae]